MSKSLQSLTKEELIQRLEALEEKVTKFEDREQGWLVLTSNPLYDGVTAGVQFNKGTAFIPRSQPFERPEPMKSTTMEKRGLTPAERKAVREREQLPPAQIKAEQLEKDFGYKVIYFNGENQEEINNLVDRQHSAYQEEMQKAIAAAQARELVAPHYMGS